MLHSFLANITIIDWFESLDPAAQIIIIILLLLVVCAIAKICE